MTQKLRLIAMLVSAFAVLSARPATAGFLSVSASGPGGTVSNLQIATTFTTNDTIHYSATYTAQAPIIFSLTLSGSGNYFIGGTSGTITNNTGAPFPSFYAYLVDAPAGSTFNESSWDSTVYSGGTTEIPPFPNANEVLFSGPPGLAVGDTTDIGVGFSIPASATGTQSLEVILSPAAIPEPSTLVLGLTAAIVGAGYPARRPRRRAGEGADQRHRSVSTRSGRTRRSGLPARLRPIRPRSAWKARPARAGRRTELQRRSGAGNPSLGGHPQQILERLTSSAQPHENVTPEPPWP